MADSILSRVRNIGIISHIDAGKTTVSERMLFYCGEIHKMGEVHDGATTMDWMAQEQQRGITITASATRCHWHDLLINLIDTPGHIDFTIEVERSLRVLDGAVAIFSAVEGVQPQSESVWRQANRYRVPRICLINKMDRIGANYTRVLDEMRNILGATPVLLQLPIGQEDQFHGLIDLLNQQQLLFNDKDQGLSIESRPFDPLQNPETAPHREALIEAAADFDEQLMSDYLNGQPIDQQLLVKALRTGTLAGKLFPVLLGSALRNKGIQPLLDAVGLFLPSPLDCRPEQGTNPVDGTSQRIPCDARAGLCALAFKVMSDEGRKLTYLRLYAGTLKPGDNLLVSNRNQLEKVARLFRMHAHKRERIDQAKAGDIVAATGLKTVLTGDSLCDPNQPVVLAGLEYPEPVVSLAVEARAVDDREKLAPALEKLQWEDPTFKVKEDPDTGQTLLTGMGELHLDVVVQRLATDFGVRVNTGRPQVVYRETLQQPIRHHEIFERELDGQLNQGEIVVQIDPLPRRSGLSIEIPTELSQRLPEAISTNLQAEFERACDAGPVAGYPLTDLHIQLLELPCDSNRTTFRGVQAAIHLGITQAIRQAKPTLLEPVMQIELTTPGEYTGRVMGSLQQKGGQVTGVTTHADQDLIRAVIPLTCMFGYMTELRSATKGRGSFTMEFSHFDQAPAETLRRFGL
jgi:elongation factor G